MFKKVKAYFAKKKTDKAQEEQMDKTKEYYTLLKQGSLFIKFIQDDLKKAKSNMNRHQRRRFEKTLIKGEITPEMIDYYKDQIDNILKYLEQANDNK